VSKRYYITPIIGSGVEGDPYRAKVSEHSIRAHAVLIPTHPEGHPQYGHPVHDWGLAIVDSDDHTSVLADPDIDALPGIGKEDDIRPIPRTLRQELSARLSAYGIQFDTERAGVRMRDLVRAVGRTLDPNFDEDRMDVLGG
jgi:hypothetical protein